MMRWIVAGVDTGGTFTDLAALSDSGQLRVEKVPSVPADPALAVVSALESAALGPGFILVHGTTVATNALLERKVARTALITTQGCRDVLEIGRQTRDQLYTLSPAARAPLIPAELRFEVPERLDARGEIVTPLDVKALDRALDQAAALGVESIAVCFLFSFVNPEHELAAGERARLRNVYVSLSHQIAPEYREFERTSTVCASASVAPLMARYLRRLGEVVEPLGARRLSVMQSSGGTLRADEAAAAAIKTALSGPAGGLIAASRIAQESGIQRVITLDMGGTSTDVALLEGEPEAQRSGEVAGIPLLTPMMNIHTIGAGGGSIARLDAAGGLRVGPQSAGADPGPVAYGRGEDLTVTDANVFLGRIPPDALLAGAMPLDRDRVARRMERFAQAMGVPPQRAARGILEVVNAQMARALRHISVEQGCSPEEGTLLAFGGAGPLHACELAEAVGIPRVLIPLYPGSFSALGLALADVRREYARTLVLSAEEAHSPDAAQAVATLAGRARNELAAEGIAPADISLAPFVEARYVGQSYALRTPFRRSLAAAARAFHRAHRRRYGFADPGAPVEIITIGLSAVGVERRPPIHIDLPSAAGLPLSGRGTPALYRREELACKQVVTGAAVLLQPDATTFVPVGWRAQVDSRGNLLLRRDH